MAISAQAAANALIAMAREENRLLSNMEVQKHVFLGQGFCVALLGLDNPLYYNNTHAWQFGPVVPKLYKSLQKYGSGYVTEPVAAEDVLDPSSKEHEILKAVWDGYKVYTPFQLSELTHLPGSPWSKTWETDKFGIIPLNLVAEYFRTRTESRYRPCRSSTSIPSRMLE